jgi:hypothetical protein
MAVKRHLAERQRICPNCREPLTDGGHFVPPSLGERGFFICQELKALEAKPMSDKGRGRRKEPWEMTGPELMKTAQAREVQAMITAWQDAAASDHAHAQRQAERAEQAEARVAKLEAALRAVEWCDVDGSVFCPWCEVSGFNGCVEHALDCPRQAALSAPGQTEGTSEPSDFDALLEHHKATEAENALFKRALEYIVRRGYHGASFVADKALAGIDVTAALSAPGQPEGGE